MPDIFYWRTVEYEHITLLDDPAADTQEIRKLLDSSQAFYG